MTKKDIPFMKYRWLMLLVSFAIVAAGVAAIFVKGINFGTDFTGGLKLIYQFQDSTNEGALTDALRQAGLSNAVVQRFGEAKQNTFIVKSDIPKDREENFSQPFNAALDKAFGAGKYQLLQEEFVGPKVGKELRTKGIYAVLWAWVIMLVYIGFRFDFYFAPGAIIALIHDVLVAVGLFALFGLEVNLTVVAAILTIIGYSINDTIIVFDRIREDLQRHKGMGLIETVDRSINETLSRTIVTSLTVFFVVIVLYFRAEGDIKNFAFAMMIGVITGTYSSISMASPVFIFLKEHGHLFGMKKAAAKSKA
ncbi:MAG: protein translocase subunit SecF [bacterium]